MGRYMSILIKSLRTRMRTLSLVSHKETFRRSSGGKWIETFVKPTRSQTGSPFPTLTEILVCPTWTLTVLISSRTLPHNNEGCEFWLTIKVHVFYPKGMYNWYRTTNVKTIYNLTNHNSKCPFFTFWTKDINHPENRLDDENRQTK